MWWQCQMTPMALAGTVRLWEQDRNPPRISWIHGAPIQQMSSPANSSWCNTNRVQVSTGMLTEGTNLQDTSLEPSFSVLEHYEGQTPAHSLVGAQHTHTLPAHSQAPTRTHTTVCAATPSARVSVQCATQMCVQTMHTHTCTHTCISPIIHPCCFLTQGESTCCHHNMLRDPSAAKPTLALAWHCFFLWRGCAGTSLLRGSNFHHKCIHG